MRALVTIGSVVILCGSVSLAGAQGQADGEAKAKAKADAKAKAAPGTLDLMTLRPSAPKVDPRRVNLFPPNVFGRGLLAPPGNGKSERRKGISLGADGDWRVHAAQVGAMALGWAALVGLCSGGKCMIPDKWMPGPLKRSRQVVPNPVRPQKRGVRSLGR